MSRALFRQKSQPLVVDLSALPVVLPEDQLRLLVGLLDPDPNRRPQNYEQLIEAIDALGVPASVSPTRRTQSAESSTTLRLAFPSVNNQHCSGRPDRP